MIYEQRTGNLFDASGNLLGTGYSGGGTDPTNEVAIACKNNPDCQDRIGMGPLPCGGYTIGAPVNSHVTGEYSLPLDPDVTNEMFGRADFLIHGDSIIHPGFASDGCIIQAYEVRVKVWESGDHRLQVVSSVSN